MYLWHTSIVTWICKGNLWAERTNEKFGISLTVRFSYTTQNEWYLPKSLQPCHIQNSILDNACVCDGLPNCVLITLFRTQTFLWDFIF